jgi:endo-1,4-beta-xylanase
MRLTRRETMFLAAATAAAGAMPAWAQAAESLDALARAKGIRFGSVIAGGRAGTLTGSMADPRYRALVLRECSAIVPENELKWQWTRPAPNRFRFEPADRIVKWAKANELAIRGHTLLWHHPRWMPGWVEKYDFGPRPKAKAEAMLIEHVATLCRRYRGTILDYDVVNEAVDNVTGEMRETAFSRQLGAENVVELAFRTARAEAPDALLVYNDYMDWDAEHAAHRAGVLRLLEALRKRGTPVDALGLQAHIGNGNTDTSQGFGARDEREWRRFLDEVTGMGLKLLITEFDVHDNPLPVDFPTRDRAVADHARAYLDVTLSYPQLHTFMLWGLSDRYSWYQDRELRPDGWPKRPCPYDAQFRPKPLHQAIADALRAAPARPA